MASTSRNSGVSSFPTHVKILPGRREKNSTAAKNTQENAASSTVALTFSPSSGSMPTVKDVEAQRGMAKKGPMVRYRAQVKKILYRGLTRPAISWQAVAAADTLCGYAQEGDAYAGDQQAGDSGPYIAPGLTAQKNGKNQVSCPEEQAEQHGGDEELLAEGQPVGLRFHKYIPPV